MTLMKLLRQYHYDPLDRLTGETSAGRSTQRFYQEDDLVTEMGDQGQLSILRHGEEPLAQHQTVSGVDDTLLLATDRAHSVLQILAGTNRQQRVYTAYGYRTGESGLSSLFGFNGEARDAITGHYLLGQGTRAFNPVLMRFNSPDELSPFDAGGINSYAYCEGDPVNYCDPTGNGKFAIFNTGGRLGLWHRPSVIARHRSNTVIVDSRKIIKSTTAPIARTPSPIERTPSPKTSTPLGSGSPSAFEQPQNSPISLRDEKRHKAPKSRDHSTRQREYWQTANRKLTEYGHEYDNIKNNIGISHIKPDPDVWNEYQSALSAYSAQKISVPENTPARKSKATLARYYRLKVKRDIVRQYYDN